MLLQFSWNCNECIFDSHQKTYLMNGYNVWKKFSSQLLCLNPLPKVQDFYKNGFSLWENRFSQKKPYNVMYIK